MHDGSHFPSVDVSESCGVVVMPFIEIEKLKSQTNPRFLGFLVSWLLSFFVPSFQSFKDSQMPLLVVLIDIDPILPSSTFIFVIEIDPKLACDCFQNDATVISN